MPEFNRPILSAEQIDPRISPSTQKNGVYKNARKKGVLEEFNGRMAGLVNEAFERAGPNWRVMRVLSMFQGAVYTDPQSPELEERDDYRTLMSGLGQRNIEEAGEFVWSAFADVVNVTRAGCGTWEEFVAKNKPVMNRRIPLSPNASLAIKYTS